MKATLNVATIARNNRPIAAGWPQTWAGSADMVKEHAPLRGKQWTVCAQINSAVPLPAVTKSCFGDWQYNPRHSLLQWDGSALRAQYVR